LWTQITEGLSGLERTLEVLRERTEDDDPERTCAISRIVGHVQFEGVFFGYNSGPTILHDITFEARPGTITAFVGPSGAGKSTLIGLIMAFHKPSEGRILIDGNDLSKLRLDTFRTQLGVVLQETFLFDGTIRENVIFSSPWATTEEFLDACKIARVDEFVKGFRDGYDTLIGERGVKLSGGQRQRLSIARALLADPRILILDEATSSLDSYSEAKIQESLEYLLSGRTTFVIAHRLSTIERADQILLFDSGRIIERGTHAELLAMRSSYWKMYTQQNQLARNMFLSPETEKVR